MASAPFDQDTHEEQTHTALSWRDVYKAVGESEERIIKTIRELVDGLGVSRDDHEARLRMVEHGLIVHQSLPAHAQIEVRVKATEDDIKVMKAERAGILSTLSAAQKLVLLTTSVLGAAYVVAQIIDKLGT